jgi:predicted ATPase
VAPEDIAVHFLERSPEGPRIRRIEIDEDGDFIDEWPGGFFEESYREKFAGR